MSEAMGHEQNKLSGVSIFIKIWSRSNVQHGRLKSLSSFVQEERPREN